ncbi:hypothetical protein [Streptomyces sp. NPDC051546]|uniref:hypothetical protein n=1 Tax=Streptomyces sp. NPDC051546 TaxID=3365655 RepID=UPI003788A9EE
MAIEISRTATARLSVPAAILASAALIGSVVLGLAAATTNTAKGLDWHPAALLCLVLFAMSTGLAALAATVRRPAK